MHKKLHNVATSYTLPSNKILEPPPIVCKPDDSNVNLLHLLFSFKGRIDRKTFWMFYLSYCGFFISLFFLANTGFLDPLRNIIRNLVAIDDVFYIVFVVIVVIFILFCTYIQIPVIVKRLHDSNRLGVNALWYLIPMILSGWFSDNFSSLSRLLWLIGFLYLLIICGIVKGTPGPNKYGESPRYRI